MRTWRVFAETVTYITVQNIIVVVVLIRATKRVQCWLMYRNILQGEPQPLYHIVAVIHSLLIEPIDYC